MSTQVVVSGSIAIDRIMSFKGKFAELIQPDKLHVLSLSVLLDSLKESRGGVAANIVYNLSLLGETPVLLGSVGANGQDYSNALKACGVDTSKVHISALPTATFTVMTDQADCQVGGFYPGAMSDAASLTVGEYEPNNSFIVVSPHDPIQMAKQVKECTQKKLRLLYDVGQQAHNISADDLRSGVSAAELLIVNDYELGVIEKKTGWNVQKIMEQVKVLVVTLGEAGCHIMTGTNEVVAVPAVTTHPVVDPTGAGDAFRGGFIYGYVRGWELAQSARLGATLASFAIEHIGTQQHQCSIDQIKERFQSAYGQELSLA